MNDAKKTKKQLIEELAAACAREEALRGSEELYRSIVESIGLGLNLMDCDHNIVMVNAAQGRYLNKPIHEIVGKKCFREFEKRDAVCPHCPGVQAIATGRPTKVDTHGVRDDGSRFNVRLRAFPTFRQDGTVSGFIEIAQDITERKRVEEALRESEERFRRLVEHSTDAFFLHDFDGKILDVNQHACESLGYTRGELLGLSIQDIDAEFVSGKHLEEWKQMVPGVPITLQGAQRRKDGTIFPVEVRLGVFESGERQLMLGLVRDITERKQAEEALQKAYEEVEKQVEEQTAELKREIAERQRAEKERARLQQEVIEAQKQALQELSTPIIPVMERIIVMPLIGSIDTLRAKDIMRALLAGIREHRAKVVILDITGVPIVDSGVANHLNKTIQAARLKGAQTIVTGIADAVAETIVDLGIDWSGIETLSDLQTGLIAALNSLGIEPTR